MADPLRYNITDWHQLKDAKSNTSRLLSIKVSDLIQNEVLTGVRIQVLHEVYGNIFTYIVNGAGTLINDSINPVEYELSKNTILKELEKYGFLVTYTQIKYLPPAQVDYLRELLNLGFDKLRILKVWDSKHGIKETKWYIVAFNILENINWLANDYSPSVTEFTNALKNGSAYNISSSETVHKWSWSWLDFVANIQDILNEQATPNT